MRQAKTRCSTCIPSCHAAHTTFHRVRANIHTHQHWCLPGTRPCCRLSISQYDKWVSVGSAACTAWCLCGAIRPATSTIISTSVIIIRRSSSNSSGSSSSSCSTRMGFESAGMHASAMHRQTTGVLQVHQTAPLAGTGGMSKSNHDMHDRALIHGK
jgi:hypothetical protein